MNKKTEIRHRTSIKYTSLEKKRQGFRSMNNKILINFAFHGSKTVIGCGKITMIYGRSTGMTHKQKQWIAMLLCMLLMFTAVTGTVSADAEMKRTVIGADLSEEQIEEIYRIFGVQRGSVTELSLTNAEEKSALEGFVDPAVIGTKSLSCVYLELLPAGSGMNVTTENISWFTPELYISALTTAGITDARIIVAAPFPVSGTAALAGVYKAYEDMTGQPLDEQVKFASTQELTITGELAEEIGEEDSSSIITELKLMLDETANMTDDEIRQMIRKIAAEHNVNLTDTQVEQLLDLCRSLEKLNPEQLKQRVEDVQNTLRKVSDAKTQVVGFVETVKRFFDSVRGFFERLFDAGSRS